jgi:hypothetical protein
MALERYCELMGVSDPGGLPAKRNNKNNIDIVSAEIVASSVRLEVARGYLRDVDGEVKYDDPSMTRLLSHATFELCAAYAQRFRDYQEGRGEAPTGPPPLGYNEYLAIVNRSLPEDHHPPHYQATHHYQAPPHYHPPPGHHYDSNTVNIPASAFNHLVDSQVRTMEIATGTRPSPKRPRPPPRENRNRDRDRGLNRINYDDRFRGRGRGRGSRGRSIPGGLGNNRRSRPSNRMEEDELMPDSSGSGPSTQNSSWRVVEEISEGETSDNGTTTETERSVVRDPVLERIMLEDVPEEEIEAAAAWLQRAQVDEEDVRMVEEKEDAPAEGSSKNKAV